MKQVLVLGSEGYIGSALTPYLSSKGYDVYPLDIGWFSKTDHIPQDYRDYPSNLFKTFDVVILLAGFSSVAMCTDLYDTLEANVSNATWLMKHLMPEQKFIYISSASVYGNKHTPLPWTEDDSLPKAISYYDLSKQMLDQVAQASNLDYCGLRLGTVNGDSPNIRLDLMMNSMFYSAVVEDKVKVANGHTPRAVLGMKDFVEAVEAIIEGPKAPGIYNLASFNTRIIDMANPIAELFEVPIELQPPSPTYSFCLNTSKFSKAFGFVFKETINSIVESLDCSETPFDTLLNKEDTYKRLRVPK